MAEQTTPRIPRRFKWLLGVSLAVNLAVVGLIVGAVVRHGAPGERFSRMPGADSYAAPYVAALPREDRRSIFRAVRGTGEANGLPDRQMRRSLYQDVIAAIRAEPFDAQALRAVLDVQKDTALAVQSAVQSVWLDRLSQMSVSERATYAAAIEDRLRRKRGDKPLR